MRFSAGTYYIGDPCYAVADKNWNDLLDDTGCLGIDSSDGFKDGCFEYNGERCYTAGTAYGDGCYYDNFKREYGVDSGLIAIMPIVVCDGDYIIGGNIVTFGKDFDVYSCDGVFTFGDIVVNTQD